MSSPTPNPDELRSSPPIPKFPILGVGISALELEAAAQAVIAAALDRRPLALTALAVHGVMTGALNRTQRYRLNQFDIVTADGQPVRWALCWLHGVSLARRVYGPDLTLRVCALAEQANAAHPLSVYFYGSTSETLDDLRVGLSRRFPNLRIAGMEPSRFRTLTDDEVSATAARIRESGAQIVFCGLGCPRQETWAYEYRDRLGIPILAVGAAFDFIAGKKAQAPTWMQERGLEWLFRLFHEPRRLWRRYFFYNPAYLLLLMGQRLGIFRPAMPGDAPTEAARYG